MNFWRSLSGMVEVRITSADPAGFLSVINGSGIEVFNVYAEGDLSLHFFIRRADYRRLRRLTRKRGELLELLARDGLYWAIRRLTARPVLLAGLALLLFLTVYLPGQIYFVEVDGNTRIP